MKDIKEIKKKFAMLQENVTNINNQKIGIESEIKTIESDMSELADKLLQLTGKNTMDEALEYFKAQNNMLEEQKETLSNELDKYLKSSQDSDMPLD